MQDKSNHIESQQGLEIRRSLLYAILWREAVASSGLHALHACEGDGNSQRARHESWSWIVILLLATLYKHVQTCTNFPIHQAPFRQKKQPTTAPASSTMIRKFVPNKNLSQKHPQAMYNRLDIGFVPFFWNAFACVAKRWHGAAKALWQRVGILLWRVLDHIWALVVQARATSTMTSAPMRWTIA